MVEHTYHVVRTYVRMVSHREEVNQHKRKISLYIYIKPLGLYKLVQYLSIETFVHLLQQLNGAV